LSSTAAFWDSSALNPLFVEEPTSLWARALAKRFSPAVWWATPIEIHSAIARLHRSGGLDGVARRLALERLQAMRGDWYEILPSDAVRDQAQILLGSHPLRAADSLQLAAALIWCRNRSAGRTFISADTRLCGAAAQAGFIVVRP
jgi:predicted nucleic acid-binding protein